MGTCSDYMAGRRFIEMSESDLYLRPTEAINSDHETIQEVAEELIRGCSSEAEKVVKLFNFVRDSIRYNVYMISVYPEDFKASTVLARGKGYCVQKAVLLTALGRAAGIPSRLTFAKIRNHRVPAHLIERIKTNVFPRHGYNQFYLGEKWVTAAATFDQELCRRNRFQVVEFDGMHDAILPEIDLDGNPHIEYLEKYGPYADLPIEWIVEPLSKIWGSEKRAWLSEEDSKGYKYPS
jgi:transglutaminase-like putative cysteine protease